MDKTNYVEASRYLAHKGDAPMIRWLLGLHEDKVGFDGFSNSVLTLPNSKQRVCDLVVRLRDLGRKGVPVAGLIEFQTKPDPDMFGRMMLAGGICWMTVKPTDLPGDRYELCAIVVNLTGAGDCARHMQLGASRWSLAPVEINLSMLDAGAVLDEVESGAAPVEVMAWIPVMQRGDDPAILQRWLAIAGMEEYRDRRGDLALAATFANAVGRKAMWEKLLEVTKAPDIDIVREWKAEARSEGRREGKADALLRVLQRRWPPVHADVADRIRACADMAVLDGWMDHAISAGDMEQFRRDAGL